MPSAVLYVENDNLVCIRRVVDVLTGQTVTDMAGTVTVYDQNNTPLANAVDLVVTYATDAPTPFYYAELPDTIQLAAGTKYKVVFRSSNYGIKLTKTFVAQVRTG